MRILLIGNYAPDRQESMLRYAALLERELLARGHSVQLLQPKQVVGGGSKWLGYVDKFLLFPHILKRTLKNFDLVHICDHSNAMYTRHLGSTPNVVTCHDVLAIKSALGEVPQNVVSSTGKRLQQMILNGLKAAQYIVCDSEASRADMLRVTGRPAQTSEVVYLSLSYPYQPTPHEEALARLDQLGFDARTPFFVHVGAAAWYKNRLGLLEIFHHLQSSCPSRLLLIGGAIEPELQAFIDQHNLESRVIRLSGVSNQDLQAAYSLAEALIYPSLQEGFGWPVIEAQSCGCPVFATGRQPMTELGGDAAIYFDPADTAGAAAIIASALPRRDQIRSAGFENLHRFTVEQMIDRYLAVYERVLDSSKYN